MAASVVTDQKTDLECDILNCPICLERFKKPKYLPCLHTFCESCLDTYIVSTQSGNDSADSFHCPVCRQVVKSPDSSSERKNWAKLFPLNHMIFSLMGKSGPEKWSDETLCGSCERDEETKVAKFWCVECAEGLCEICSKCHRRNKTSTNHRVIPVQEVSSQDRQLNIPDIEEPCPNHRGEILKVYCVDHQKMCCVICLSINHRKCEEIKPFDEMVENLKNEQGKLELCEKIAELDSKVETVRVRKQDNMDKINSQQKKKIDEASDLVGKAKQNLDKYHGDFKVQFSQIHKEQSTKISEAKDRIEHFQKTLSNGQYMLKAVLENGSPKQLFIMSEKVKDQVQVQGHELEEFLKDDKDIEYNVTMNQWLTSFTTSMSSIADIKLKFRDSDRFSLSVLSSLANQDGLLQHQLRNANIADLEAVKLWDVKAGGRFTGGLFLRDGSLLCSNYSSKTLSINNDQGQLNVTHSLNYYPWDVTENSNGNIIVTDRSSHCMKIYTLLHNNFTEIKSIKLQNPRALCVLKDHILVESRGNISVLSSDGEIIRNVTASEYTYITSRLSHSEQRFYYCHGNDVVCQSLDGRELFRHTLKDINETRGIALDCADNVYVCGKESKNIYVVSKDGRTSRVFISDLGNLDRPYAIGFNENGTRFFITGFSNGTLSVYKLCFRKKE